MTGVAVMELAGVHKAFRARKRVIHALDGLTTRVQRGVVTGLIGPDGAGKTTLMRVASGLLAPDEGTVRVLDIDVKREPLRVQQSIGYMPQRFGLYEDLTVRENLDLYADLQGVPLSARPARYAELLHMTGLTPFTRRLAGRLSGGMKQKLGLACTLVRLPPLLLLDEPTVGVDPVSRRELWGIINRMVEAAGATVLLSTAYLDEAERCAEVILIHEGRLLGQGPPADFSRRVAGRSFRVVAPAVSKRRLQERLTHAPAVVDALLQADGVRVVVAEDAGVTAERLLPEQDGVQITPVPPRFEDAFVALLRERTAAAPAAIETRGAPATPVSGDVIIARNVERRFGDFWAVRGISFVVRRGEVFGLLGANGAGKSTTFRMLCGLLPASAGTLEVAGQDLNRAAAQARARIGYMAQRFSLYGDLSVLENLRFFSATYGLSGAAQRARLDWALDELELRAVADVTSSDLPQGFKQRLALAVALMHQPDILLLDEPTSGVDPLMRREFWRRINALSEKGVTVLVTTHFMEEAEYCDRLVIMAAGEILAEGTPAQMKDRFRSPEHPSPTMEDAFVGLLEAHAAAGEQA